MFTNAQRIIIEDVCSIQYESLINILTSADLGFDGDGENYENLFTELGIDRKDFDKELIKTIRNFEEVRDNPEGVLKLGSLDMLVFRHILFYFANRWEPIYPNALRNLWDKLFYMSVSNLNQLNDEEIKN